MNLHNLTSYVAYRLVIITTTTTATGTTTIVTIEVKIIFYVFIKV